MPPICTPTPKIHRCKFCSWVFISLSSLSSEQRGRGVALGGGCCHDKSCNCCTYAANWWTCCENALTSETKFGCCALGWVDWTDQRMGRIFVKRDSYFWIVLVMVPNCFLHASNPSWMSWTDIKNIICWKRSKSDLPDETDLDVSPPSPFIAGERAELSA